MRRMRVLVGLGTVVIVSLAATSVHFYQQAANGQLLFQQVAQIIDRKYVDSLGSNEVFEKAANGLVEQLNDPYSELMPPKDIEAFERGVVGKYGGIGAVVETRTGNRTFIVTVYPNTPAERGGVQPGDEIIAVDSVSTVGFEMAKVTERTRGDPGTKVKVTFLREGVPQPIVLTMTRAQVHIPAVPYAMMIEPGIGYVPMQTFYDGSAEEVGAAFTKLRAAGAKGLILDLRSNPGGLLGQALDLSSLFLKRGQPIVVVRRRNERPESDVAQPDSKENGVPADIPLVVLTDEGSASASEIVAGSLQDHDRALIVGQRTYGKGLVQETFQLEGDYLLKVTTGKYFLPSGRTIHRDRIMQPDGRYVEVPVDTVKKPLPQFKSDAGRTLLGGGGVIPDVRLSQDTISTAEQNVYRAIAPVGSLFSTLLLDEAQKHKASVKPNFVVDPSWLTEINRKVDSAGFKLDEKSKDARQVVFARELGRRIARAAFSDSGAARREFPLDNQLMKGVELLRGKMTQAELFATAK